MRHSSSDAPPECLVTILVMANDRAVRMVYAIMIAVKPNRDTIHRCGMMNTACDREYTYVTVIIQMY